ncbi:MAG TPA: hypothetical protein VFW58_04435, partial [Trichococcus sp.]|nr:hypothetical protein [Trichococcus sp.]
APKLLLQNLTSTHINKINDKIGHPVAANEKSFCFCIHPFIIPKTVRLNATFQKIIFIFLFVPFVSAAPDTRIVEEYLIK